MFLNCLGSPRFREYYNFQKLGNSHNYSFWLFVMCKYETRNLEIVSIDFPYFCVEAK